MPNWSVPRAWPGETVFIVGGGTSVLTQPIHLLKGRRVIAINSSFDAVPFADYLFFYDKTWWQSHQAAIAGFAGDIVTAYEISGPRVKVLRNCASKALGRKTRVPLKFSDDPGAVPVRRTSFTGAINMAVHLTGKGRIVLLGADGKFGEGGRRNHYRKPYGKRHVNGCWDWHHADLADLKPYLAERGIEVLNASPGTAWADLWPVVTLEEVLAKEAPLQVSAPPVVQDAQAYARTRGSVAYRNNFGDIWGGAVPSKYSRIIPHVKGNRILDVGAAEGVLALALAHKGKTVTALELRQERHDAAVRLQERWQELGRAVFTCTMKIGDIRDNYGLLDGIDTLIAMRCIYYLREDIPAVFAEIGRRGVPRVVLAGNPNRASRFRLGHLPPNDKLGRFNFFASIPGMTEALNAGGYCVVKTVTDGDPIVVGER